MPHEAATYQDALTSKTPAETKAEVEDQIDDARDSYQSSFEATEEQYQERADLEGAPLISAIDPESFEATEGDTDVTITLTGEDFTGVTSVTLSDVEATEFTINDDHEIEVTFALPEGAAVHDLRASKGELRGNIVQFEITLA